MVAFRRNTGSYQTLKIFTFLFLFQVESHYIFYTSLELIGSRDLPVSTSGVAGSTGMYHHASSIQFLNLKATVSG